MNYKDSGVDIEKGDNFVEEIKKLTKNSNIGGFAGIYEYNGLKLVGCCDGVGSKLEIATKLNKFDTIGIDLVAMSINDLLVQGAKPLFFLDYLAVNKLDIDKHINIVKGIKKGCDIAGCVLLGGETAEMPTVYNKNGYDLAGFALGVIENESPFIRKPERGDIIIGLESSGVHSNGYTLINRLLKNNSFDLNKLLIPTKIYTKEIEEIIQKYKGNIKAFVHITGGGFENINRVLDDTLDYSLNNIELPEVFQWIMNNSDMSYKDMLGTYNCGYGFCVILDKDTIIGSNETVIGKIV